MHRRFCIRPVCVSNNTTKSSSAVYIRTYVRTYAKPATKRTSGGFRPTGGSRTGTGNGCGHVGLARLTRLSREAEAATKFDTSYTLLGNGSTRLKDRRSIMPPRVKSERLIASAPRDFHGRDIPYALSPAHTYKNYQYAARGCNNLEPKQDQTVWKWGRACGLVRGPRYLAVDSCRKRLW